MGAQAVVPPRQIVAEVDAQCELVGANGTQRLLNQIVQFIRDESDHRLQFEILHRRQIGKRTMPARRRHKRDVIPETLIFVGSAKIEQLDPRHAAEPGLREVRPRADDLGSPNLERPFLGIVDDDEYGHDVELPCA